MSNDSAGGATAGYAGDVSVQEAWRYLAEDARAVLIDVRSEAEWAFVGQPELSSLGKAPLSIAWQHFPGMTCNDGFVADVTARVTDRTAPLLFLCRSGARSRAAATALTAAGYEACYNVLGGFEGDLDADRHRGTHGGWKAGGLPWAQR